MELLSAKVWCLLVSCLPLSAVGSPNLHKKGDRPDASSTSEFWFKEQRLDHFTYKPEDRRWKQRYLFYEDYWLKRGRKAGPIFFYGKLRSCMHSVRI
jgi:hypothetical protein